MSVDAVVAAIEAGGILDVLKHRDPTKYARQSILIINLGGYAHFVPFVEEAEYFFLKTIVPSRKATRDYLNRSET